VRVAVDEAPDEDHLAVELAQHAAHLKRGSSSAQFPS
jgi:hypothetical protein